MGPNPQASLPKTRLVKQHLPTHCITKNTVLLCSEGLKQQKHLELATKFLNGIQESFLALDLLYLFYRAATKNSLENTD